MIVYFAVHFCTSDIYIGTAFIPIYACVVCTSTVRLCLILKYERLIYYSSIQVNLEHAGDVNWSVGTVSASKQYGGTLDCDY